jgi:DNA polymerase I
LARIQARGIPVEPGAWTTAASTLRRAWAIEARSPNPVVQRRALDRLRNLSAYSDEVQALAAADPEGRVRCAWDAASTWAGRVYASGPCLQQIQKGHLRRAVVAPPGRTFVIADWKHAQLRILAALSGDPALLALLSDPSRDVYEEIATAVLPGAPRDFGKKVCISIQFLAGAKPLCEAAADFGIALTEEDARGLLQRLAATFPRLWAWRKEQIVRPDFLTPLGRAVSLPSAKYENGRPYLPSLIAGIAQAWESDALRWVVALSARRLSGTGAEIILLLHDGLIWEVPEGRVTDATIAIETLMLDALRPACVPCPPRVEVEVRRTWGKPAAREARR